MALRRITSSTTFMSPSMYMRSLTLFMADINITANKFKEKYFQSQSWKNDRKYCTILSRFEAARKVVLAEYSAQ